MAKNKEAFEAVWCQVRMIIFRNKSLKEHFVSNQNHLPSDHGPKFGFFVQALQAAMETPYALFYIHTTYLIYGSLTTTQNILSERMFKLYWYYFSNINEVHYWPVAALVAAIKLQDEGT